MHPEEVNVADETCIDHKGSAPCNGGMPPLGLHLRV